MTEKNPVRTNRHENWNWKDETIFCGIDHSGKGQIPNVKHIFQATSKFLREKDRERESIILSYILTD